MKMRFGYSSAFMRNAYRVGCGTALRPWSPLAAIAAFLISTSLATGQSAVDASRANAAVGDAQNGRRIFVKDGCYGCHGREAQGGGLNGPRLAPDLIPIEAFLQFVRRPSGEMPPYTPKVISNKDLTDIYAFLETIPQPPPVSSIAILKH